MVLARVRGSRQRGNVGQEGEAGIKKRKKVFKKRMGFFNFHFREDFFINQPKYIIMFYKLNIYINFSHLGVKAQEKNHPS